MKFGVIGTGAIGGYYGGRLAQAGEDVHFLVHRDYNEMKESLRVDSINGSFIIEHPNVYISSNDMPKVDVVLVALKTINNMLLPTLLSPIIDNDTIVILLQNGICVEEDLEKMRPNLQLVAGLGFICSTKIGPAHISHQDFGALTLANYSCRDDWKIEHIADIFRNANIPTDIVEYNFGRWRKAIWNLTFNGLTVVLQRDTQYLVSNNETLELRRTIMNEVISIAHAIGVNELKESHINDNINATKSMKPYAPSMKVDYDNHRPMQVYYLYTKPLMVAELHGVNCPKLKWLENELRKISM